MKGGEDTNCRQRDDYMKKCDSYQAANIKRKKISQKHEEIVHEKENEQVD